MEKGAYAKLKNRARRWKRSFEYHFLRNNRQIRSHDYRETVVIGSMGRSGSTWLSEILNYRGEYRELFEPFQPYKVPEARPFPYPCYLRPGNSDPHLIEAARTILKGRFTHPWTDTQNFRHDIPGRLLIKDIRINLMLKWIHVHFPEMPLILLVRHPMAVVKSWIKVGFDDGTHEQAAFLANPELLEDHLAPFAEAYRQARTSWERLIFYWCVFYYVPLRQFKPGEVHVVFYENINLQPEEEVHRLSRFLGRDFGKEVFSQIQTPSRTTVKDSAIHKAADLNLFWKKSTTEEEYAQALRILRLFGLDQLYTEDAVPDEAVLQAIMEP